MRCQSVVEEVEVNEILNRGSTKDFALTKVVEEHLVPLASESSSELQVCWDKRQG